MSLFMPEESNAAKRVILTVLLAVLLAVIFLKSPSIKFYDSASTGLTWVLLFHAIFMVASIALLWLRNSQWLRRGIVAYISGAFLLLAAVSLSKLYILYIIILFVTAALGFPLILIHNALFRIDNFTVAAYFPMILFIWTAIITALYQKLKKAIVKNQKLGS